MATVRLILILSKSNITVTNLISVRKLVSQNEAAHIKQRKLSLSQIGRILLRDGSSYFS